MRVLYKSGTGRYRGFTLIELLIVLALVGILTALSMPSFETYLKKTRAKGAAADLVALSLALENRFQKNLSYPIYANLTVVLPTAEDRANTAQAADFGAWAASQREHFEYKILSPTASAYTLTAVNKRPPYASVWCTITLTHNNPVPDRAACPLLGNQ